MALLRCDFRSEVLDMVSSMNVVLPESMNASEARVVYLLHGLADNCSGWLRYTSVERYARTRNIALVIPEVQRSFYTDMEYGLDYFAFIHDELPEICSRMFSLSRNPGKNYIMGLSMGGYGALKCVLSTPERYSGCATFSAVTDLEAGIRSASVGRHQEYQAMFGTDLVLLENCNLIESLKKEADKLAMQAEKEKTTENGQPQQEGSRQSRLPAFYMACGAQDALFSQNACFADHLKSMGANCTFESWDGIHNWDFWDEAVKRAFSFFFS